MNKSQQIITSHYVKIFWIILCIAFLLRLYVTFFTSLPWFTVDSYSYLNMANAILNGEPFSRFPNGFPLFISFLKIVFPDAWIPFIIVTLNVLASTAVVGLGMQISKKISGSTIVACLAGFIIAVYPNQLNYVRQILTEAPTTFLLVLSVYLFFKRTYFLSGFFLAITVLFRSSLMPLIPLMLICFYFFEKNTNPKISGIKYGGGIVLILTLYCVLLASGIVIVSNNLTQNILISIHSNSHNIDFTFDGFTKAQLNQPVQTYIMFAIDHPLDFIKQRTLSFSELWLWPSSGAPPRSLLTKLLISLRIPILLGAIIGFKKNIRKVEVWVLFLPILMITAIHTLFFSTTRFTYVVEPFASILAIIGLFELIKSHNKNQKITVSNA